MKGEWEQGGGKGNKGEEERGGVKLKLRFLQLGGAEGR